MNSVNNFYYVCPDGHITVGDGRKQKCSALVAEMTFTDKGKKHRKWIHEEVGTHICEKELIETHPIPKELSFNEIWNYRTMHAFLLEQKMDAGFFIEMQKNFCVIHESLRKILGAEYVKKKAK